MSHLFWSPNNIISKSLKSLTAFSTASRTMPGASSPPIMSIAILTILFILTCIIHFKSTLKYQSIFDVRTYFYHERSEEHTSELQSRFDLVCRLLLEKKN